MAGQTMQLSASPFLGTRVAQRASISRPRVSRVAATAGIERKVNSYDEGWSKGFWGTGLFVEDKEVSGNYLKSIERKKLLTGVERLGLLSKAESAGLTLAKVEQLGLLSTAERLGLLTLAEKALTSDPGAITSLSIPFFVATLGALVFIPHDNFAETALSYGLAAIFFGGFGTFFLGGFVVKALQED